MGGWYPNYQHYVCARCKARRYQLNAPSGWEPHRDGWCCVPCQDTTPLEAPRRVIVPSDMEWEDGLNWILGGGQLFE